MTRDGTEAVAPATGAGGSGTGASRKPSVWALPLRVASTLLFIPLLVVLARVGDAAFLAFVAVQVTLALLEFYRMVRTKGLQPSVAFGLIASYGVLWVAFRPHGSQADFLATAVLLLALAFGLRRPDLPRQVESMAVTLLGVFYVAWLSAHLVLLRELPWRAGTSYDEGASFVLLAFFVTWSCDSGAFMVGRILGRTRPWTRISPHKSVEGSVGGFLFAIAAAFIARAWFAPFLRVWDAAAVGVLVGIFAQVGDLVESLLKRDAAAGDSSDLIPGHGGVLDRFDSLYFGAPIVYYYLKLVVYWVP